MISTPRSLYVHVPWCIRKCPYCDFNSHEQSNPDFKSYGQMLCKDLASDLEVFDRIPFISIFFGGGTPSLMPPEHYRLLFDDLLSQGLINSSTEVTLEANPGTLDLNHLTGYLELGINRLSIGVQSFQAHCLQALGRVHNSDEAIAIIKRAQDIGFHRINVDLMHGTPGQRVDDALADLDMIHELDIKHLSWYQLTIERNTVFHSTPPKLPDEEVLESTETLGEVLISDMGLQHYEISAFAVPGSEARHNLNYWEFGDYLGIGAGAHGKITGDDQIVRTKRTRHPRHYLNRKENACTQIPITKKQIGSECLMNGLRLKSGVSHELFEQRTGLNAKRIRAERLQKAIELELLEEHRFQATQLGWRHLNSLLQMLI